MTARHQGQVGIVSSVAGIIGIPGFGAYSASKNAVRAYGEAIRVPFGKKGVEINVICPGFVVSRITNHNGFKMPFLMTSEKAAKIIANGLSKNKPRIAFPFPTYATIRLLQILPIWLKDLILK
jgi:short-subunit dehydrogenase